MSEIIIRLSPDTPQETIQRILALVVAPEKKEGRIHNATVAINTGISVTTAPDVYRPMVAASSYSSANVQPTYVKLIPVDEPRTANESSWLKLIVDAVSIPYYVVWTGVGILTFLALLQPHIQDIEEAVTGFAVHFEQLMERVTKTLDKEQRQPTPKNDPEKSGPPSAISSGD
jgi:hypothetical protein